MSKITLKKNGELNTRGGVLLFYNCFPDQIYTFSSKNQETLKTPLNIDSMSLNHGSKKLSIHFPKFKTFH